MASRRPRRSTRPGLPHPTQSHSPLLRRGRIPVGMVGLLAMVGLVLPLLGAAPAAATSQGQVQAQINSLATRIAILDEEYNTASIHLQQLQIQIHDSQAASAQAESDRAGLRKIASQQAVAMYKQGAPDIMITLLTSKSLDDFNQKMQLISQANQYEEGVVTRLQIADQRAKVATDTLTHELAQAQAISATLSRERTTLGSQLASQQTLLAQINAATRAAEAAAAAARAQAARAALARAEAAAAAAASRAAAAVPAAVGKVTAALPPLPTSSQAAKAVQVAMAQIGKPYVWAGAGPNDFDCSGLTMYAWGAAGVLMPHSAAAQYAMFPHVSTGNLQPGDLVFFGSPIHHVGMYVGGGQMVDAPETGQDVQVQSAFESGYVGASRP